MNFIHWRVYSNRLFETNLEILKRLSLFGVVSEKSSFIAGRICFRQLDVIRLRHVTKQPVMIKGCSLNSWTFVSLFVPSGFVREHKLIKPTMTIFLEIQPDSSLFWQTRPVMKLRKVLQLVSFTGLVLQLADTCLPFTPNDHFAQLISWPTLSSDWLSQQSLGVWDENRSLEEF